jgi:hypothetical protein
MDRGPRAALNARGRVARAPVDEIQLRGRDRHPDAPARRPICAHAELGDEGLGRPRHGPRAL